jgi:hypothetical protein
LPRDVGPEGLVPDFFRAVRLVDGVVFRCRMGKDGGSLVVVCEVEASVTWREIKARLWAKANEIPLE